MSNFIMTFDKSTSEKLKSLGFKCVKDTSNRWLFLNNKSLNFDKSFDMKKIKYTDSLNI